MNRIGCIVFLSFLFTAHYYYYEKGMFSLSCLIAERGIVFVDQTQVCPSFPVPILLEHAQSSEELTRGLMGRKQLPENRGMLFHFPDLVQRRFWSYCCHLDLAVAFMNEQGVIQEIQALFAYPEKNGCLDDEEEQRFFLEHAICSQQPAKYVLETNLNWFAKNHLLPGSRLIWSKMGEEGVFLPAIDLFSISRNLENQLVCVQLPRRTPRGNVFLESSSLQEAIELDIRGRILKVHLFPQEESVFSLNENTSFLLLSPKGNKRLLKVKSGQKMHGIAEFARKT